MTIKQFNNTGFTGQMNCRYDGYIYAIASVDFEEKLIGIYEGIEGAESREDISWKRCENIEIL